MHWLSHFFFSNKTIIAYVSIYVNIRSFVYILRSDRCRSSNNGKIRECSHPRVGSLSPPFFLKSRKTFDVSRVIITVCGVVEHFFVWCRHWIDTPVNIFWNREIYETKVSQRILNIITINMFWNTLEYHLFAGALYRQLRCIRVYVYSEIQFFFCAPCKSITIFLIFEF